MPNRISKFVSVADISDDLIRIRALTMEHCFRGCHVFVKVVLTQKTLWGTILMPGHLCARLCRTKPEILTPNRRSIADFAFL